MKMKYNYLVVKCCSYNDFTIIDWTEPLLLVDSMIKAEIILERANNIWTNYKVKWDEFYNALLDSPNKNKHKKIFQDQVFFLQKNYRSTLNESYDLELFNKIIHDDNHPESFKIIKMQVL